MPPQQIVAIMGPTACGKTELALRLAEQFDVSLISVDSASVYRGLNIGTSKPPAKVLERHPHALIDILEPEVNFSVSEFVQLADEAVSNALDLGRTPLLVGGTMLYFKAFREGISPLPPRNEKFREQLRARRAADGTHSLYAELTALDPVVCQHIHENNYPRIERALEIYSSTGQLMSDLIKENPGVPIEQRHKVSYTEYSLLHIDRSMIHQRIESRFDQMLKQGLLDEVRKLKQRPNLSLDCTSMRAVGYRQIWEYLESGHGRDVDTKTRDKVLAATRKLARRQVTWMRGWAVRENHFVINELGSVEKIERRLASTTCI